MITSPVPNPELGHFATSWSPDAPVTKEEIEQVLAELEKLPMTRAVKNTLTNLVTSNEPKARSNGIAMINSYAEMHHNGIKIMDTEDEEKEQAEKGERKKQREEEEKWAKNIKPKDLDRMAYKATKNVAALEELEQETKGERAG
jgi:hypothetical protein